MEYTKIPHLSFSRDMHNILNSSDYEHTLKQQFCWLLLMKNGIFCILIVSYAKNKDKFIKPRHIRMIFFLFLVGKSHSFHYINFCQCLDPAFIILCKM